MKKKLLSTILCLAILITVMFLVLPKTNAESPFYYYEMGYNEWGDMQAWITGIDPSAQGDLEIPMYIGNYIITGINHNAFLDCTNITSITMPETVTFIGDSAFSGCTNLKNITIGDSVTTIYAKAFSGCTSLEKITLPYSVETVGDFAFSYCTSLVSADLGSIDELGSMAFYKCESLKDVSLGNVKVLESETFGHCTGLETITLPDSLTNIESRAFVYCTALKSVKMPYSSLESIGDEAFRSCSSLQSITIPYGTKTIGDAVFFKCTSLTRIDVIYENGSFKSDNSGVLYNGSRTELIAVPNTLSGTYTVPATVTSIRPAAFYGCDKLTGLSLPDSITEIGEYAFKNCTGLTTLTIPKGLTTIAESAWENCTGITQVTISDTLSVVDYSAFDGCTGLTEVYYDGTQEQWDAITIQNFNDPLLQAKLILPDVHDCTQCGQWVVSLQPTFSSAGERYLVCSQCGGTVTETLEMLVGKVEKLNMVLQDDFEAKFYLQVSESIRSTAQVKLTVGNSLVTTPVSALEVTLEGYCLLPVELTAAQMNDTITIQVINGEDQGEAYQYTVRQYCDTILADSDQSQYHALIKEMLNYGAMAQLYFGHNTDNLVNEGITGVAAQEVPEETEQMSVTGALNSLSYYGASLVYRDRIAVRFYFTGDITGCTFTVGSATYAPVAKDGMHYVEIADILPQNLDQQITLTVTDSEGNALVVTYGPMNYIVRMTQKGDEKTKNLLKALYNYHLAAKALTA